eukprot:SAG22_NODE_2014_length_3140_cov_2.829990_1_plen_132_part_10
MSTGITVQNDDNLLERDDIGGRLGQHRDAQDGGCAYRLLLSARLVARNEDLRARARSLGQRGSSRLGVRFCTCSRPCAATANYCVGPSAGSAGGRGGEVVPPPGGTRGRFWEGGGGGGVSQGAGGGPGESIG